MLRPFLKRQGFKKQKHGWEGNCDIGEITTYKDLNGDGLKDAIISDADSTCYGREMVGYHIISQQKKGIWKMIVENRGIPTFLDTRGKDGWPDLINAGSGFALLYSVGMVKNIRFTVMNMKANHVHYDK